MKKSLFFPSVLSGGSLYFYILEFEVVGGAPGDFRMDWVSGIHSSKGNKNGNYRIKLPFDVLIVSVF